MRPIPEAHTSRLMQIQCNERVSMQTEQRKGISCYMIDTKLEESSLSSI